MDAVWSAELLQQLDLGLVWRFWYRPLGPLNPHWPTTTHTLHTRQFFHMRRRFTFIFSALIYCICSQNGLLHIGETKHWLGDRYVEHLRSVRLGLRDLPVAKYFNSPSYSHADLSALGLFPGQSEATLKLEVQQLIFCPGRLHPAMSVDSSNFK